MATRNTSGEQGYDAPILVSDYMVSNLIKFKADHSILQVMEIFAKNHISGGPVVDDRGALVGVISEADCMKPISDSRYYNLPLGDEKVEKFMTKEVETIQHDRSIFDAATMFHGNSRRRLPVIKDGKLVGQISRKDIVIAALKLSAQNYKK